MKPTITPLAIADVLAIEPPVASDTRGFFSETYNRTELLEAGVTVDFVQDNHARSTAAGTLRGLHFQLPPHAQDKLVRVVRGAVLDVAVDLRAGSPTYARHVSAVLSEWNWRQIFVPVGFAHGLLTLEPNTEVIYKVSRHYAPDHDRGLLWNDPALGIDWGIAEEDVRLSDKDRRQPTLDRLEPPGFTHP